jgi:hypothetical protein
MFSFYPMGLTSALRRKRDEIAASIAVHEARIDAARMDLAALNQVARLFDPEAGRDETDREFDKGRKAGRYPPRRNAKSGSRSGRSPWANWRFPQPTPRGSKFWRTFYIWTGRNVLKSLDSKK